MSYRNHGEEIEAALAAHRRREVQQLHPLGHDDPLGDLYRASAPKPGCPGVRIDGEGREWYSSAWIDLHGAAVEPTPPLDSKLLRTLGGS